MTLRESTLLGDVDKVQTAIDRLRHFEPSEGYWLAFSGGKDSIVILELAKMAGVKYTAHYNVTTVDPPELVKFIRQYHRPEVIFHFPPETMFQLIVKKWFPPTRIVRYCCGVLKESNGEGTIVTGVRKAESTKRAKRQFIEACNRKRKGRFFLHPIFDWSDADVWEFIKERGLPYCELYDQGQKRIGCVMCPMKGNKGMVADANRWPNIANLYLNACDKLYERGLAEGKDWKHLRSGRDIYNWWVAFDSSYRREGEPENERFFFQD